MAYGPLPPEVNSSLLTRSAPDAMVAESWIAGSVAWQAFAEAVYGGIQSIVTIMADISANWLGEASLAALQAMAPNLTWLGEMAAMAEFNAGRHAIYSSTYIGSAAAMPQLEWIVENRVSHAVAEATNFLGINTPEIIYLNSEYAAMWTAAASINTEFDASMSVETLPPTVPSPAPITVYPNVSAVNAADAARNAINMAFASQAFDAYHTADADVDTWTRTPDPIYTAHDYQPNNGHEEQAEADPLQLQQGNDVPQPALPPESQGPEQPTVTPPTMPPNMPTNISPMTMGFPNIGGMSDLGIGQAISSSMQGPMNVMHSIGSGHGQNMSRGEHTHYLSHNAASLYSRNGTHHFISSILGSSDNTLADSKAIGDAGNLATPGNIRAANAGGSTGISGGSGGGGLSTIRKKIVDIKRERQFLDDVDSLGNRLNAEEEEELSAKELREVLVKYI